MMDVANPSVWTLISRQLMGIELNRKKLLDYQTGWRPQRTRYMSLTIRLSKKNHHHRHITLMTSQSN